MLDLGFKVITVGREDADGVAAVALQEWMEKMAAVEQVRASRRSLADASFRWG